MGVPDMYSVTVLGVRNLRAAIENEEKARKLWQSRWGWILDEYKKMNEELAELKKGRGYIEEEEAIDIEDKRTMIPFPETEGHEYGFLASKPEFRLELYPSPGLSIIPKKLSPAKLYKLVDERMAGKAKHKMFWRQYHTQN